MQCIDILKKLKHIGITRIMCVYGEWNRAVNCLSRVVSIGVSRLWNCLATTSASVRCWRTSRHQLLAVPVETRREADQPRTCRRPAQCRRALARVLVACFQSTFCLLHSLPSTGMLALSVEFLASTYFHFRGFGEASFSLGVKGQERMRPVSWCQCFELCSMLLHCWLCDWNVIRPVNIPFQILFGKPSGTWRRCEKKKKEISDSDDCCW